MPLDLSRRNRRERRLLLLATLALGAWALGSRLDERAELRNQQGERLAMQVRAVEQNLALQLQGMQAALRGLRSDLPGWEGEDRLQRVSLRMEAQCAAIPGMRNMAMMDAAGTVVAAGRRGREGLSVAGGDWFSAVRAQPDPTVLFVSPPFATGNNEYAVNLSVALTGPHGELLGAIAATLDAAYFNTLLGSVLDAPDMRASIVHGDGGVLVVSPASVKLAGLSVAGAGSLFSRHLASGQAASLLTGVTASTGDERMMAYRTLQPPYLATDKALVLAVSRNVDAMLAPWQRQSRLEAGLGAALAAGSWALLLAMQRRRTERECAVAAQQAREVAEAERLRPALHGGDLALWDVYLPTQRATINERWLSMLGYAPHEVTPQNTDWEALLHPEDRARVLALRQAHLDGLAPQFEATYRLRHKHGHWVWVLARGRVVEHTADGTPLRMVGTHMEVTSRMQAEDTLRRSEQKTRALLAALSSGVVLHGLDTQVLEANPAACRMLGLSLDQMLGKVAFDAAWAFLEDDGSVMPVARFPVNQVLARGAPVPELVVGVRRPELPCTTWVLCSAFALYDADGALHQVVVTFSEFTQSKQAEDELQRSAARLRQAGRLARLGGWTPPAASCGCRPKPPTCWKLTAQQH